MSTAGIYNVHVNVLNQGDYLKNQMNSQQKPFFFGGSQVPINLNMKELQSENILGTGIKKTTHNLYRSKGVIIPSSNIRR